MGCIMMELKKGPILWCGADDSNHAGDTRGEFIIVTFSTLREDSIVKPFPNCRDYKKTHKWLEHPERDYRFTILSTEKYRNRGDNVPSIAPYILHYYLKEEGLLFPQVNLYLDGWLNGNMKREIRDFLTGRQGIEKVVVDNFTKKGNKNKFQKRHNCPELVYRADTIANEFTSENRPVMEILSHEKLVPLDALFSLAS
jgi:hypothetical protein